MPIIITLLFSFFVFHLVKSQDNAACIQQKTQIQQCMDAIEPQKQAIKAQMLSVYQQCGLQQCYQEQQAVSNCKSQVRPNANANKLLCLSLSGTTNPVVNPFPTQFPTLAPFNTPSPFNPFNTPSPFNPFNTPSPFNPFNPQTLPPLPNVINGRRKRGAEEDIFEDDDEELFEGRTRFRRDSSGEGGRRGRQYTPSCQNLDQTQRTCVRNGMQALRNDPNLIQQQNAIRTAKTQCQNLRTFNCDIQKSNETCACLCNAKNEEKQNFYTCISSTVPNAVAPTPKVCTQGCRGDHSGERGFGGNRGGFRNGQGNQGFGQQGGFRNRGGNNNAFGQGFNNRGGNRGFRNGGGF